MLRTCRSGLERRGCSRSGANEPCIVVVRLSREHARADRRFALKDAETNGSRNLPRRDGHSRVAHRSNRRGLSTVHDGRAAQGVTAWGRGRPGAICPELIVRLDRLRQRRPNETDAGRLRLLTEEPARHSAARRVSTQVAAPAVAVASSAQNVRRPACFETPRSSVPHTPGMVPLPVKCT